ncbi:MAG: GNAT family N-acetyltransferase [Acidimicrobiales bacterium]
MEAPRILVRPRTRADLPPCETMLLAVHAADGYPVNLPEDPVAFLDVPELLGSWVAERTDGDRALVGHVVLRPRTADAVMAVAAGVTGTSPERMAVVARLLVAPAARRLGVGRALLEAATARAHALGRRPVLDVVKGSEPAIALYERAGWRRCGEARVTYGKLQFDEIVYAGPEAPCSPHQGGTAR